MKDAADSEFFGEVGDYVMGAVFLVGLSIILALLYFLASKFKK